MVAVNDLHSGVLFPDWYDAALALKPIKIVRIHISNVRVGGIKDRHLQLLM